MTIESLKYVNNALTDAGIAYEYERWESDLIYPYFVGEYTEPEMENEDGLQESTFIITGTTDGTWLSLEEVKETIKKEICDKTAILPNGNGIAVFFAGSMKVPTGNERMKRIQINLLIKEWEVK